MRAMAVRSAMLQRFAQLDVARGRQTHELADRLVLAREHVARLQREALIASRHALHAQALVAIGRCAIEIADLVPSGGKDVAPGASSPSAPGEAASPQGTWTLQKQLDALDQWEGQMVAFFREAAEGASHARVRRGMVALETGLLEGNPGASVADRGLEVLA